MIFVAAITDLASCLEEAHPTRRMPTSRITDRRRERALAANPASKEPGTSNLKRLAAVRVHRLVASFHSSFDCCFERCSHLLARSTSGFGDTAAKLVMPVKLRSSSSVSCTVAMNGDSVGIPCSFSI